jgi:hypothetical protein
MATERVYTVGVVVLFFCFLSPEFMVVNRINGEGLHTKITNVVRVSLGGVRSLQPQRNENGYTIHRVFVFKVQSFELRIFKKFFKSHF